MTSHDLTTEKVKMLYATYDTEQDAVANHDMITATALSSVFKAERFLSEQYEAAAWNTVKRLYENGIFDKESMLKIAKDYHGKDETASPIALEVFKAYLTGQSVRVVIKRMILEEFSSVFSLEGFYASYGIV